MPITIVKPGLDAGDVGQRGAGAVAQAVGDHQRNHRSRHQRQRDAGDDESEIGLKGHGEVLGGRAMQSLCIMVPQAGNGRCALANFQMELSNRRTVECLLNWSIAMPRTGWSPNTVPYGADQTVYLVVDRHGSGSVYREAEVERTDFENVIDDFLTGQFNDPVRVVAFNTLEHWANDVSRDVAQVIARSLRHRRRPGARAHQGLRKELRPAGAAIGARTGVRYHLLLRLPPPGGSKRSLHASCFDVSSGGFWRT